MPIKMSVVEVRRGPALMLDFTITASAEKCEIFSGPFDIVNTATVWFKFKQSEKEQNSASSLLISILRKKHESSKHSTVELYVSCKALNYSQQMRCPKEVTFGSRVGEIQIPISEPYSLRINMFVIKKKKITFAKLYGDYNEDTNLTDLIHLTTEKGSVAVHRTCLALHSDMFHTMLLREWKETTEGRIELKGFSLKTLQQLKEYIYLGTLPEDVRPLLLLAKCYLLDNLKQDCLMRLVRTVSSENMHDLQDFACENNVNELSRLLIQVTDSDIVHGAYEIEMTKKSVNDETVKDETEKERIENDVQNEN